MTKIFTIIEDCAPYYVRFTHNNIEKIIEISKDAVANEEWTTDFSNKRLGPEIVETVKELSPLYNYFDLSRRRVAMFVSQPGLYYQAHKDGLNHKFSLNYTVKILDDKCVTSWYSDEDLKGYQITNLVTLTSRECMGFDKTKHTPLKTMVAKPNECILFNSDIFHDWDNSASDHERMVLTLRLIDYSKPGSTFEDARQIILGLS